MNNIRKFGYNVSSAWKFLLTIPLRILQIILFVILTIFNIFRFPVLAVFNIFLAFAFRYLSVSDSGYVDPVKFIKFIGPAIGMYADAGRLHVVIITAVVCALIISIFLSYFRGIIGDWYNTVRDAIYDMNDGIAHNNRQVSQLDKLKQYGSEVNYAQKKISDFKKNKNYVER